MNEECQENLLTEPGESNIGTTPGSIYKGETKMPDETHEYFCKDCLQLRLAVRDARTSCGNCGSKNIIIGKVGDLDKSRLLQTITKDRKENKDGKVF